MIKKEFVCVQCEAEFYIETDADVLHCISCGEELQDEDTPLYDEDEVQDWDE